MKEELPNEKLREAEDMEIDIKELLFKCLIHWPWFVGTVVACLIAAYVYLYVATPVYNISATVLIKDDKKGGASNNVGGLDELGLSGLITSSQSIDNEIEVLRSKTLVKEVVNYLNLYVTYKDEDLIPSKELYKTSPVQVNMTPQEAEKLKKEVPDCDVQVFCLDDQDKLKEEIAKADILLNGTLAGMKPHDDVSLITDKSVFRPDLVVCDVVYNPEETKLLREAREAGCAKTIGGKGMLLWQGVAAYKLYTGLDMPVEEYKKFQAENAK